MKEQPLWVYYYNEMKIQTVKRPWIKASSQGARYGDTDFYRSTPWRTLRASIMQQRPFCESELHKGKKVKATVLDHITAIKLGGEPLNPNNLMPLCNHCHAVKSSNEGKQIPGK